MRVCIVNLFNLCSLNISEGTDAGRACRDSAPRHPPLGTRPSERGDEAADATDVLRFSTSEGIADSITLRELALLMMCSCRSRWSPYH